MGPAARVGGTCRCPVDEAVIRVASGYVGGAVRRSRMVAIVVVFGLASVSITVTVTVTVTVTINVSVLLLLVLRLHCYFMRQR